MSVDAQTRRPWLALAFGVAVLVAIHLLALLVVPDAPSLVARVALGGVVGVVVTVSLSAGGEEAAWAVAAGLASATAATGGWLLATGAALWLVAVALAIAAVITSYAIHRFELLAMGVLEDTT